MVYNKADSPGFYSVPIHGTEEEGFSPVYRHPDHEDIIDSSKFGDVRTSWDLFQVGFKKNPDGDCVGKRKRLPDGKLGEFEFKTYTEFFETVKVAGSSLVHHNFIKEQKTQCPNVAKTCKLVGLFLPSCEEWLVLEQACYGYGYTLVPIYNTLGDESILYILSNTELEVVFCTEETGKNLLRILAKGTEKQFLNTLVLVDTTSVPKEFANSPRGLKFMLWSEFMAKGEKDVLPPTPGEPNALNIISYTSGTTGVPKGVMITHKQFVDTIVVTLDAVCKPMGINSDYFSCHLSYLPMAHMFEKDFINAVFYSGGKIGIYSGDVKLILEDLQTLKPVLFVSVPRLYQRIHDKIMTGAQSKPVMIRGLFNQGLRTKMNRIRNQGIYTHKFYDKLIFDKVNKLLGGNVKWLFVGSSCLNSLVIERVRAMMSTPLFWGYALTECCAGGFVQHKDDTNPVNLGGPSGGFQFRLRSIPELKYFVNEKPMRGELLIRGTNVSAGYFKMDELTKETFKDGWLYTGDVVELMENGSIKVIDRIKQVFKLAQGEYVAPEYVESIINSCMFVAQSYVVGNSDESYPVGVVVPDEEALGPWKKGNGMANATLEELAQSPELKKFLFEEVQRVLAAANVKGFQRVKAIHLHGELFSVENDMLTVTFKLKRNTIRKKFETVVDEMYKSLKSASEST
nr:long-chain-fatty-acid--CoA ligase [Theileria orientalis]